MSSWRDQILREFTPGVARLTIVADPDGLLLEEGVLEGIRERGFELIPFEDHIAFRYAYESKYRSRWDRGKQTDLVVVLHSGTSGLFSLPYDLIQAGRELSFNLGEFFPNLSYPVITALDRGDLDTLYKAQAYYTQGVLGDNATKEFVLRHVFDIAPELIKKPSDLLRVLLRRHYHGKQIPVTIDERFIQILRQNDDFIDWPLNSIIPNREAFFAFLQERWPIFLDHSATQNGTSVRERGEAYGLEYPGPVYLPFDHEEIRVYIDNFFIEGLLQAVPHEQAESFSKTWLSIGVRTYKLEDRTRRIDGLLDTVAASIPKNDARYDEWCHFAKTCAELMAIVNGSDGLPHEPTRKKIDTLQTKIDSSFVTWLKRRYAGLINLPPVPPVMLHHIPHFLARHIGDDKKHKVAIILVDGLALDQWIAIRKVLNEQNPKYCFRENEVFSWIPTITSVSRQAAFSGRPPVYFPNSISTMDKEPALWTQFWADHGLTQHEVSYAKGLGNGKLSSVEDLITHPKTRAIGLVVNKVDKIMHGMELGSAGMHNQVRQWAGQPFLSNLLDLLLDNNFYIYLTSDHGNIEAAGCGRPIEGAVADLRGERVRIYSDAVLRDQVMKLFPDALEWPSIGLPEDFLPLIAPGRSAFVRKNDRLVGHGGISLEEIIVPFVKIERKA